MVEPTAYPTSSQPICVLPVKPAVNLLPGVLLLVDIGGAPRQELLVLLLASGCSLGRPQLWLAENLRGSSPVESTLMSNSPALVEVEQGPPSLNAPLPKDQAMRNLGNGLHALNPEHVWELMTEGTINAGTLMFTAPAQAIWDGNAEDLERVLKESDWDLRYSNPGGNSVTRYPLLTLAARRGDCACIEVLLKAGASIDEWAMTPEGTRQQVGTALMVAIENQSPRAAALLLERKADPNGTDAALNRPTHLAAIFDDMETLPLLAAAGADIGAANMNGRTALHVAIRRESTRAITWLLERGAPIKEADHDGDTPLHYALKNQLKAAAHVLIEHGATCAVRCQRCTLQTKLVQRAIAKSAEKRRDVAAQEAVLAAITPEDQQRSVELMAALMAAEKQLVEREKERAEQKSSSKAQKKKVQKQRQKLKELRETMATLRDPASNEMYKAAVVRGRELSTSALESRFDEEASSRFIANLSLEGGLDDGLDDGAGLTQEEIDSFLANAPAKISKAASAAIGASTVHLG